MKDISDKAYTQRKAIATAALHANAAAMKHLRNGTLPKGDAILVAKVAAIQAAKNTPQIIPYCHPLQLEHVGVEFDLKKTHVTITVTVAAFYKTGVEMEALTAATVAALTIYDMMKMIDPIMHIDNVVLVKKTGGKSDINLKKKKP
jgi:cyclic pyranopterin phosphate synthase